MTRFQSRTRPLRSVCVVLGALLLLGSSGSRRGSRTPAPRPHAPGPAQNGNDDPTVSEKALEHRRERERERERERAAQPTAKEHFGATSQGHVTPLPSVNFAELAARPESHVQP